VPPVKFETGRDFAQAMTAADPLAAYRDRFHIPRTSAGSDCVYLCGHSLGLQPKSTRAYIEQELQDWERLGVEGHFHARNPWLPYHELLTASTARLVGALPSEVVVMNSLTVNLHLMMVSFYRPTRARHQILIESSAFPSDQYALQSQIRFHGYDPALSLLEIAPRSGETTIRSEDIETLIAAKGPQIALILLGGVNYYTGQAFDCSRITQAARAQGCVVGFDIAHAAGNRQLQLHDWGVDFAVWCSYKYLNGGPGCVGGCFVLDRHARNQELPRFAGWWGHDKSSRFQMPSRFAPMADAAGWQLSNPSILSLAALRASMEIFDEVTIARLRAKSETLTGYLEFLLAREACENFSVLTPQDPSQRGAQLSLQIKKGGRAICERLAQQGIICDWREPHTLRVAPVPLYNSFLDAHTFADQFLAQVKV
jgi:kynureninase